LSSTRGSSAWGCGAGGRASALRSREALLAPHLIDLEVVQVLRRYAATKQISAARALEALDDLGALRLTRWPHDALTTRVWELRDNLTAYDAAYVALAETRLGAGLRAAIEIV
jgi:predicted nucleic acid-binding protein